MDATAHQTGALQAAYAQVRARSLELVAPLSAEDMVVQSMPDASPAKWHLAHTTWFFETFLLAAFAPDHRPFDPAYGYLFNSYYDAVGARQPRAARGLVTRPPVDEVRAYRAQVDQAMGALLAARGAEPAVVARMLLGLAHEEQHQELLLTDLKHLLAANPLAPAYRPAPPRAAHASRPLGWHAGPAGLVEIGHAGAGFAFDNEGPRHTVHLAPYALADRLVTNAEFRAFIDDGGYRRPELWLADGWSVVQAEGWVRPLYWREDLAQAFTLHGLQPLAAHLPAAHLSYYEADAYARWAGARLPTEAEWEALAAEAPVPTGTGGEPAPEAGAGLRELFGACWQWTGSAYLPYPGYRATAGALGEYNGKFMANQFVLRGSSSVTPAGHARATYRNFFYPAQRWQFAGLRLARDL